MVDGDDIVVTNRVIVPRTPAAFGTCESRVCAIKKMERGGTEEELDQERGMGKGTKG
jgi:hypothetical protein